MPSEELSVGALLAQSLAVVRKQAIALLAYAGVVLLLCLPCAAFVMHEMTMPGGGPPDPVLLWTSFTPLEKLGNVSSIWFMSLGLMGITQAVCTLAAWDACAGTPSSVGNLAARLGRRLHRILGLQLFVVLMPIFLVPLSVFTFPAMLVHDLGVFRGFEASAKLISRHAGKTILILLAGLVAALGWAMIMFRVTTPNGPNLLASAFAFVMRLAMFYVAGAVIAIPATVIYHRSGIAAQTAV